MDSDESKPAVTPSNMPRYVKEFEETYFWKRVMLPSMRASILEAMERLVYLEDVREYRNLQAMIKTTQTWIGFPKRKHTEAVDDNEFEAEKNQGAKEDSETA